MTFASNAHTHSTWCDGRDSVFDMLKAAQALGFVSLGFSSHASQCFDYDYSMSGNAQSGYFDELRALQKEPWPGMPRLWAGLELDVLASDRDLAWAYADSDYIIGSTHYLCKAWHGVPVGVDGDPETLKRYVQEVYQGDGLEMARAYYDIEVEGLKRLRPQIIGHFDLVRKYASSLGLFAEQGIAYRRLALNALERSREACDVLEVNTGGMARGYLPTPYPTPELLRAWRDMGGFVTLTSDCHNARYLDFAFLETLALIREAGFQSVLRLGTGRELWQEVAL